MNNNSNDYRKQNIKINTPHKYLDIFPEPKNYTILEYGSPYKIIAGKYSGQYRNMYWKVKNNNLIYYLMHIKDDIYTKISLDDIDKVLYFKNTRSSYYIHSNGYIATTVNSDRCFYYLHQLIMDVHDENLSDFTKTVDHINRDKLDNRRGNLRSVDMSIQNSNRDKSERRKDAIELPNGINQSDLPKYIVYRKEILNKNNGRYREYFYICNHPKLKRWETPKSNKLTIQEKLNIVIKKIEELNNDLKTGTPSNSNNNSDNDSDNNLTNDSENNAEIKYEYNKESKKMKDDSEVLSNNLINNSKSSSSADKIIDTNLILPKNIKLNLPPNFSFYKEKGKYYFQYAKVINKIRYSKKIILASNDIQLEFNNFVKLLNNENSNLKIDNYIIPNIPNDVHIVKHKDEHIIIKPTMPVNFSITTINNVDYIQFSKKGNGLTKQYKTKINSYDIHSELDKFIDYLNSNYSLELNKDNYKIINDNNWKTSNKIIDHDNPTELQLKNRKKALKSLNKKKEELGKDEFNKQRNEYMKNYRNLIFTQSRD